MSATTLRHHAGVGVTFDGQEFRSDDTFSRAATRETAVHGQRNIRSQYEEAKAAGLVQTTHAGRSARLRERVLKIREAEARR